VANGWVVALGIFLLIITAIGYFSPVNDQGHTAIMLDELCTSAVGQLALFFGNQDVVQGCQYMKMLTFGIYGFGLIGFILIIVGAVVPSSNQRVVEVYHEKPQQTRKEWNCEHCDFKSEDEVDLIEHYKGQHADEKGDSYQRKYGKKPLSPETLEILKRRYAQGEITKEEFEQMKKDLENS